MCEGSQYRLVCHQGEPEGRCPCLHAWNLHRLRVLICIRPQCIRNLKAIRKTAFHNVERVEIDTEDVLIGLLMIGECGISRAIQEGNPILLTATSPSSAESQDAEFSRERPEDVHLAVHLCGVADHVEDYHRFCIWDSLFLDGTRIFGTVERTVFFVRC